MAPRKNNETGTVRPQDPKKTSGKQKQKQKQQPAQRAARPVTYLPGATLVPSLPECSRHYASALINPWDTVAGVCIPAGMFSMNSLKHKSYIRGQFQLGTTGFGYISVTPRTSNNQTVLTATTSASVFASGTAPNAATGLTTLTSASLPYALADFSVSGARDIRARIVAFGIRVKYVGPLMNRNGVALPYLDADCNDTATETFDYVSSLQYVEPKRIGDADWDCACCYAGPIDPTQVDFTNQTNPIVSGGGAPMMILIKGVAGDTYEFDYCQHSEYIGNIGGRTKSHSDPSSFAAVTSAAQEVVADRAFEPSKMKSFAEKIYTKLSENLPKVVSTVGKYAIPIGAAALGLLSGNPYVGLSAQAIGQSSVKMLTH